MRSTRRDPWTNPTKRATAPGAAVSTLILALAVGVPGAEAQSTAPVVSGSRVRITSPAMGLRQAVGTVQEVTEDTLVVLFHSPRRSRRIDAADIEAMDISVQRERRAARGMGTGALVGGGAGAVLGLMSGDDPQDCWLMCFSAEEKAAMFGIGLGLTGAVTGLIAGLLVRHDVWSPAEAGARPPVGLALRPLPVRGGTAVQVGVTLRLR
jgi:hypothetical protein